MSFLIPRDGFDTVATHEQYRAIGVTAKGYSGTALLANTQVVEGD